jgi:bacterioferritin-associated ferredoxin
VIVCSCNVFSENEVRRALASAVRPPRVSQVYACLGYPRQCGRCARTIKKIMATVGLLYPQLLPCCCDATN